MLLSVIVPTYNEEENIQLFYDTVSPILNDITNDWEILFVNDGSIDKSAELIMGLREKDNRICLINLSRNYGSYSAISAGFLHARGDAIACISCDLQDPPELIKDFVTHWQAGADIAWGVRATRSDPGLKSFYANTFYWILKRFIWRDFPEGGMDYGLFDRRIIDTFNKIPVRNTIPFLTIYDMGFRQVQIPYHRRDRRFGYGKWTFARRVKSAVDVLLDFSFLPIRTISLLGYMISFLSFVYAFVVIINRVFFGLGDVGWPSLAVIILFLGGLQLVVLGVIGEYLWRVAEQVRERPRFLIMDMVGVESGTPSENQAEDYIPHAKHMS